MALEAWFLFHKCFHACNVTWFEFICFEVKIIGNESDVGWTFMFPHNLGTRM